MRLQGVPFAGCGNVGALEWGEHTMFSNALCKNIAAWRQLLVIGASIVRQTAKNGFESCCEALHPQAPATAKTIG